jgi:GlpG protein
MRQIGNLPHRAAAQRFASYLVAQGIGAHAEEGNGNWAIWVREEDQLHHARTALAQFVAEPDHPRYRDAERIADSRIREESRKREQARQNTVQMRDRWGTRQSIRRRPLTVAVIVLCGILGLATDMGARQRDANRVYRALMFADPAHFQDPGWGGATLGEKLIDVRRGQLWRIVTPAFLHADMIHLAFNVLMFYQLGSLIEPRQGSSRLALLIFAIAIPSNLAQALVPETWGGTTAFLGLSGVVYGLLGFVWMESRYAPQLGVHLSQTTIVLAVAFMLLGFVGYLPFLANWVHGVGFLVGDALGIASGLYQSRPKRE